MDEGEWTLHPHDGGWIGIKQYPDHDAEVCLVTSDCASARMYLYLTPAEARALAAQLTAWADSQAPEQAVLPLRELGDAEELQASLDDLARFIEG